LNYIIKVIVLSWVRVPLAAPIYCFIQSDLKYIKNKKFKPSYYFMLLDSILIYRHFSQYILF